MIDLISSCEVTSMVRLFTDPRMLDHVTPPRHPERPERLRAVLRHLERLGLTEVCRVGHVREATDAELLRVHEPEHLDEVRRCEEQGGGLIDADTYVGKGSNLAARLAAGAAVEAVRSVIAGPSRTAFCAVRPPGHHARPANAMGFCLFGNAAIAARAAIDHEGLSRVLIVDWDVHHGNGTQEVFYQDGRVGFLSIHRYPFYPGTGAADETGSGPGLGSTCNLPIRYGTARADYRDAFRNALERFADRLRPELILISAGFDAHYQDPIGDLGLDIDDFVTLTEMVMAVARTHASGRIVSLLEGGYNVPVLATCIAAHLACLGAEPADGSSWADLL
jgi:acetoin utilization deacetylase AcuC-like enzyme